MFTNAISLCAKGWKNLLLNNLSSEKSFVVIFNDEKILWRGKGWKISLENFLV
jgi:hypothetical protein